MFAAPTSRAVPVTLTVLRSALATEPNGEIERQKETFTDLVAAADVVLGQCGRAAPVVIIRSVTCQTSDNWPGLDAAVLT